MVRAFVPRMRRRGIVPQARGKDRSLRKIPPGPTCREVKELEDVLWICGEEATRPWTAMWTAKSRRPHACPQPRKRGLFPTYPQSRRRFENLTTIERWSRMLPSPSGSNAEIAESCSNSMKDRAYPWARPALPRVFQKVDHKFHTTPVGIDVVAARSQATVLRALRVCGRRLLPALFTPQHGRAHKSCCGGSAAWLPAPLSSHHAGSCSPVGRADQNKILAF